MPSLFSFRRSRQPPPAALDRAIADDPEIVIQLALTEGDSDRALTLLMDAYGGALYRFCMQMVQDEELARDVHQLTFVQAYESFAGFRHEASFKSWLFSIARNRCLDALKIQRRRLARIEPVAELPDNPLEEPDAEDALAARAVVQALGQCLARLAPQARLAVLLRFQEEVSYPEMGRICGERAATLQARVARALPVLRRCLEEGGVAL